MRTHNKPKIPRWLVGWGREDHPDDRASQYGKIGRLPRVFREELNRRLRQGEPVAALLGWLNGLSETPNALAGTPGAPKITPPDLARWRKTGFHQWQARQNAQWGVAGHFRAWVGDSQTRLKLSGPPVTEFVVRNRLRKQFGQPLMERKDIPPGENWDIPLNRKERGKLFIAIVLGKPYRPGERKAEND